MFAFTLIFTLGGTFTFTFSLCSGRIHSGDPVCTVWVFMGSNAFNWWWHARWCALVQCTIKVKVHIRVHGADYRVNPTWNLDLDRMLHWHMLQCVQITTVNTPINTNWTWTWMAIPGFHSFPTCSKKVITRAWYENHLWGHVTNVDKSSWQTI